MDITFAVSNVANVCAKPTKEHWTAVKHILRYLKDTFDFGLLYDNENQGECIGFSDWAGDLADRRSTSGYLFQMCGTAVSCRSKKQTCVALTTAEAEYIALASAAQEAIWIRQLVGELNNEPTGPMVVPNTLVLNSILSVSKLKKEL